MCDSEINTALAFLDFGRQPKGRCILRCRPLPGNFLEMEITYEIAI